MKTFVKITALAFVLFNTACEPEEFSPRPPVPPGNWKTVSIDAHLTPKVENYGDGTMFLRWSGNATYNSEKLNISLSHEAYDLDENNNFAIQGGTFNLWTDDYQHTLSGTYTGSGYEIDGQFMMEGNINVQAGTGKFTHENAALSFSIAQFFLISNATAASEILIRGKLKAPTYVDDI